MSKKKVILITGASSGLGWIIAKNLASKGNIVYGTSRSMAQCEKEGVKFIKLDIISNEACEDIVSYILTCENRIDVIINNAGITLAGKTLEFNDLNFKNILDINTIGPFRLIKAVFAQPKKPKMIINITSLNGFLALPNFGLYCASKFAIEALGFSLRYELAPLVKVVNVAVGAICSDQQEKMPHKTAREKFALLRMLLPLTSREDVALCVEKLIGSINPPSRILVGRDAKIINFMQKILPLSIFEKIIFYIWRKK